MRFLLFRRPALRALGILLAVAVLASGAISAVGAGPQPPGVAPQQLPGGVRAPVFLPVIRNPEPPIPPPVTRPNVQVSLRSSPTQTVNVGQDIALTVQAENFGNAKSSGTTVRIDYDRARVQPVNSSFDSGRGDWVSSVDNNRVLVQFGSLSPGERRSGNVYFRVQSLSPGTQITLAGEYPCGDDPSKSCFTNRISLQVASSTSPPSGHYTLKVSPDRGPPGTVFNFSTDLFQPGEKVVTWLNVPGGQQPLDMTATADSLGRVWFTYNSGGLAVGDYALVAYGQSSRITAVGPFRVQGPNGLASAGAQRLPYRNGAALPRPNDEASAPDTTIAPQQALDLGGISGRVTAADTSAGLADVLVLARNAGGAILGSATTAANGRYFIFFGLATGTYSVEFVTDSSVNATTATYAGRLLTGVSVTSPNVTPNVSAALTKAGAISGLATAVDGGAPLEGVPVFIYDSTRRLVGTDLTNEAGSYRVGGLASGSYTVWFSPSLALDTYAVGYADSAYTGNPVAVSAPTARTGISQALARDLAENRISGRVTDASSGAGIPGVPVLITDLDDTFLAIAQTDSNGRYATDSLDPISVTVSFLPGFSAVATTTNYLSVDFASNPIDLSAGTGRANVNAALAKGGRISGRVTAADTGKALEDVLVAVFDSGSDLAALTTTDENGAYVTPGVVSGSYKVEFFTGFSAVTTTLTYVGEFYSDKPGLPTANAVGVTAPNTTANINAALAKGGKLSGRVTAAGGGQGLADVFVVVFDPTQNIAGAAFTDATGNYTVNGLPSGSYLVLFDTIFSPNPTTSAYLDLYYGGASTINEAAPVLVIAPNTTPNINQALARGGQISGRVTAGDTGAGLAGVFVQVFASTDELVDATVTDANGNYVTPGLPAGAYRVNFDTSLAVDTNTAEYQSEFYNDKADLASANVVTVAVPAGAPNINAALVR